MKNSFIFKARIWLYPGEAGWHFITLPKKESGIIQEVFAEHTRGFGSLRVEVTTGNTSWKTSIFPDKKTGSYILPLKKEVRKKEDLKLDSTTSFQVRILI